MLYDDRFYDGIADGSERSARIVAGILRERSEPESVLDVGCGRGWWGRAFADLGARVVGVDGDYVADPLIDDFHAADLALSLPDLGRFDLAICLEVAEHLPQERAASFVADLCRAAPTVVFSAAIPHQTGAGHINLQWPTWWARLFAEHGYGCDDSLRFDIWGDARIEPWYRQNLLIFDDSLPLDRAPLDVTHPVIHDWGR